MFAPLTKSVMPLSAILCALLTVPLFGDAFNREREGPGLFERNRSRYYLPPVDPRVRTEKSIPPVDIVRFRRPWGDEAQVRLDTVQFFDDWKGGVITDGQAASRYEVAYFVGRLAQFATSRHGKVFPYLLKGPRHVRLPRVGWGGRQVRLAVRTGLFHTKGGGDWWLRPMSRGSFARLLFRLGQKLEKSTPVLQFSLRFPPPGTGYGVPLHTDPRHKLLRWVYRRGLMDIMGTGWDVRTWVDRSELATASDRLVFVIGGYREPEGR